MRYWLINSLVYYTEHPIKLTFLLQGGCINECSKLLQASLFVVFASILLHELHPQSLFYI